MLVKLIDNVGFYEIESNDGVGIYTGIPTSENRIKDHSNDYTNKKPSSEVLEALIEKGFSADEIIKMKKKGVI